MMKPKQAFRIARKIYAVSVVLSTPLLRLHQWRRARRGKEDQFRIGEREGIPSLGRPEGKLIWFHCASVGESMAVLPVIEKILAAAPDTSVLMSTGTVTSARLMEERFPKRVFHQYAPLDHPGWVRKFLDHWKPDGAIWVESEFWPNTLCEVNRRSIPLMLVNARVSNASYMRWKQLPSIIEGILGCFDICLAQTKLDARHLSDLGARQVVVHGNLKLGAAPLPVNEEALATLNGSLLERPRWLVSSSHNGEELIAAHIHEKLASRFPDLVTIIVPRHPSRGMIIADMLREKGIQIAVRSHDDELTADTPVYIADTMGELGLFYRACDIVFMGKSLVQPGGGQNPFEPAMLGCAVLFGPNMGNFMELSEAMQVAGAARQVTDAEMLCQEVAGLIDNPAMMMNRKRASLKFCANAENIVDDTASRIEALMIPDYQIKPT